MVSGDNEIGRRATDLTTDKMAAESLAFCSRRRVILVPGVSHWIQHEEPDRMATKLIVPFRWP